MKLMTTTTTLLLMVAMITTTTTTTANATVIRDRLRSINPYDETQLAEIEARLMRDTLTASSELLDRHSTRLSNKLYARLLVGEDQQTHQWISETYRRMAERFFHDMTDYLLR